ncbi:SIR2 family protein [Caballeronia zhejiangensis]|uniref:SIR2 family protein n=1 Tax=Caballeronia zhejiangensis TaxID=871203 RepID=UPI00158F3A9A|nr:SIR2 family protein [Caballeronia zhejiangensis]MCI1042248.1 SIR2 family protein [Caballeronia zhejiangensis]
MITWPQSLIREIAARRCIFFLGSGVSATSCDAISKDRPKTWGQFLDDAVALVPDEGDRAVIEKLIKAKNFLVALQGIRDKADPGDFRNLLDRNFNNHRFEPSELHQLIHDLDSRIVITTNFDRLYENYCLGAGAAAAGAFKIVRYDSNAFCDELRSDTRLIIKAHGTIDEISGMVFTRSEYHNMRRKFGHFYEILKALFLTHTVVFIGCGLEDPDVMLLLEDVKILGSAERPHYAITRTGEQVAPIVSDWKATYNVRVLEYGPEYADLIPNFEALLEAVEKERSLAIGT